MDTTTLGRRGLLAVLVAVTAVLAAATPARAATEADAVPAGAVTAPVPPEEGHGAQLHLARADIAPPSDRTEARAGYSKPGWLPFRNRHTLGCVTTNCNGSGHALWGMDIAFRINEPIYASGSGRVYLTVTDQGGNCPQTVYPSYLNCPNGARGNSVVIDHGDNVYTFYGHMKDVRVRAGQMVTEGTVIGSAGNSGWTSPHFVHLHYEEWAGLTWAGGVRTPPRPLKACHDGTVVTYPNAAGTTSWNGIPGFNYRLRHDGGCNPNGPTCVSGFYDVLGNHQFCIPITSMVNKGITTGYDDNLFHPQRTVSRQTAVVWLYRLAGSPSGTFPSPGLRDVPSTHPYRTEIAWAVSRGIVRGYEDDTFRGTTRVTRAEMVTYLYRMAGSPNGSYPNPKLRDVTPDRPFFREISWAVATGVAKGFDDGTFQRGRSSSRQHGSTFVHRFDERVY